MGSGKGIDVLHPLMDKTHSNSRVLKLLIAITMAKVIDRQNGKCKESEDLDKREVSERGDQEWDC